MTTNVLTGADRWHDLLDVRAIDQHDPQQDLKEPTYENVEVGERFGPETLVLSPYRALRFGFIMGGRDALAGAVDSDGVSLAHPGSYSNELFEIYTLNYAASKIIGLHASEEFWLESPARVGESVSFSGSFVDKYEKRGQGYAVVEGEARDIDGRLIARRRGTEIMRTVPGDVAGRKSTESSKASGGARRISTDLDRTARRIEAQTQVLLPEDWFAFEPQLITFEQAALYSRFGEYVESIHGDLDFARAAGLSVPIVQGQQQMCLLLDGMLALFGPHFHVGGHIAAKFIAPVRVFSHLTLQGRVVPAEGDETVRIECWLTDESGRTVTVATADWTAR